MDKMSKVETCTVSQQVRATVGPPGNCQPLLGCYLIQLSSRSQIASASDQCKRCCRICSLGATSSQQVRSNWRKSAPGFGVPILGPHVTYRAHFWQPLFNRGL